MKRHRQLKIAALIAGAAFTWLTGTAAESGAVPCNQSALEVRPFRISDSVTEYCAVKPRPAMCEEFERRLSEFLAESRDARWAAPVEKLISKSTLVNGKPRFEMRALECRRSLCVLEYAVSIDDLGQQFDGYEELSRNVELVGGITAPELKPGGGVLVSALIWRKR